MNPEGIRLVDNEDDITEIGIENNGPWADKNESIYMELMNNDVKNYSSRAIESFTKEAWQMIRKNSSSWLATPTLRIKLKINLTNCE